MNSFQRRQSSMRFRFENRLAEPRKTSADIEQLTNAMGQSENHSTIFADTKVQVNVETKQGQDRQFEAATTNNEGKWKTISSFAESIGGEGGLEDCS